MSIFDNLMKSLEDTKNLHGVYSFDDYHKLSESKRTRKVWWWFKPWYILPASLKMNTFDIDSIGKHKHKGIDDWSLCFNYLRKKYPIQYFLREGFKDSNVVGGKKKT